MSKYICIYLIHVKDFGIYFFRQLLGERFIQTSPPFSPVYTLYVDISMRGLLLYYYAVRYTAYILPYYIITILPRYNIYIILHQHLYKYSTREYQLIIDVVVTTYVHRYYVHMKRTVCCYIFRYGLGCYCVICHAAR